MSLFLYLCTVTLHIEPFLSLLPSFLHAFPISTQSLFGNKGTISSSLQLHSESSHQWLLPSPKRHLQAECTTAKTYHSPIHLSCHCSLPAHHTRVHGAHIHGWHIQVHSLHKMLQGQKHISLWERNDECEVHIETEKNEKEVESRHRSDLWSK